MGETGAMVNLLPPTGCLCPRWDCHQLQLQLRELFSDDRGPEEVKAAAVGLWRRTAVIILRFLRVIGRKRCGFYFYTLRFYRVWRNGNRQEEIQSKRSDEMTLTASPENIVKWRKYASWILMFKVLIRVPITTFLIVSDRNTPDTACQQRGWQRIYGGWWRLVKLC